MFRTIILPLSALLSAGQAFAAQKIVTFDAGMDAAAQASLVESRGGTVVKEFAFINAVLADFPDTRQAAEISRAPGVNSSEDDGEIYQFDSEGFSFTEAAYLSARDIRDREPRPARPPAVSTPPAPISPVYLSTANAEGKIDRVPWSAKRLQLPQAWAVTMGKGARVAVLDSGVDCSHPDLAPNCAGGYNALNPKAAPHDDDGHGTHVAGIIAGARNGSGMAGMAPEATIVPVKVLNSSGTGKVSDMLAGIDWMLRQNIDIANMSFGSHKYSEAQARAVKAAAKAGILLVCAAGNDSGPVGYPAAYEEAVAVTAMNFSNRITDFSCRGPETDFTAPGERIYSAYLDKSFYLASGTSQAAPHVSGLAALAVSLGVKGPEALRAALVKASYNVGLKPEEQGAGVPVAAFLVNNILSAPH